MTILEKEIEAEFMRKNGLKISKDCRNPIAKIGISTSYALDHIIMCKINGLYAFISQPYAGKDAILEASEKYKFDVLIGASGHGTTPEEQLFLLGFFLFLGYHDLTP